MQIFIGNIEITLKQRFSQRNVNYVVNVTLHHSDPWSRGSAINQSLYCNFVCTEVRTASSSDTNLCALHSCPTQATLLCQGKQND